MKKRLLSLSLVLIMIFSLTVPAFASGTNCENITVKFPNIDGVYVRYYTTSWTTVGTGLANSVTFKLTADYMNIQYISVTKDGMSYTFSDLKLIEGENVLDVPMLTLNVFGVASDCSLGISTQYNWVYRYTAAKVGQSNFYTVFDNGETYKVTLYKEGFDTVTVNAVAASGGPNNENNANWQLQAYFAENFYRIAVPEGVSNVWISSNSWAVKGSNASDLMTLVKTGANANMTFVYGGKKYETTFILNGSNPFDGLFIVNFSGVEGVTIQKYVGGVWTNVDGIFNNSAIFNAPETTSIRVLKGGMTYQVDGLKDAAYPYVIDVPVGTITVEGIGFDCNLSIVGSNWVYQNIACTAATKTFNVFGGRTYELQISKTGFNTIKIPGLAYDETKDISEYFYTTEIPEGVTNVRLQSNGWIADYMQAAIKPDGIINLLKTGNTAKLSFVCDGTSYNVDFTLDGDMYAPWWVKISAETTCSLEGYVGDWNILSGWKGNYSYTPKLGHDWVGQPSWDGHGWLSGECFRCDWQGYLSYVFNDYATDAQFLQNIADEIINNGLSDENLILKGETLSLVFGDRVIELSTSARNKNVDGRIDLGDGWFLVFNIKGNGSNIKAFVIEK